MKKVTFLVIAVIAMAFSACSKSDDAEASEQKVWFNGYELQIYGLDKEVAPITFLFFPENIGKEYATATTKSNVSNIYEYTKLPEDETYTMLLEKQQIKLKDGTVVNAVHQFSTSTLLGKETLEKTVPIGRYFVVALYSFRDAHRSYWNKYACKYYDVISRYNPITLTAVIPGDLTQYGCIPWINWEDNPYKF